ncbi:hypothetical protein C4D60_Mb03t10780 [Musa balbisiana]|uniref:Uncharacterized protein n=1 Tax=Musa balbisiana TaxID=52838 RepID=A0A4S8J9D8_MUSBA|nr:hypothetical protein C4D60_Mb03t10780 [Musa balbisiana]
MTTSGGVWVGDNPLHFTLPTLIYQILVVFVIYQLTHAVLRPLGQPLHVSQIVAGIILGPNVLSRNKTFGNSVVAPEHYQEVVTISITSYMLFFFVIGVKADLGVIPKVGKKAVAIGFLSTLLPIASVSLATLFLKPKIPLRYEQSNLLILLTDTWCMTSYPVLSCLLSELNLLTSKLGRLAMSATLITTILHAFASVTMVTYIQGVNIGSPLRGLTMLASFLALLVLILFVMRPIVLWLIRRTPEGALLDQPSFVAVISMALASGMLCQMIGFDPTAGPFFFGLVLPGGPPLGATLAERMDCLVLGLLLPLSMAFAGMRTDLTVLADASSWWLFETYLLVIVLSKFVGVILPCLYCRMSPRETISLGLMLATKGIYEVYTVLEWAEHFHAKPGDELRVLACIHLQDNVKPIISLLEAAGPSRDSPICTYLIHLIQLVGRTETVLLPHKWQKNFSSSATALSETDHIVNAFRLFERQYSSGVSVLPYFCISPYSTMHDDICSLALDKKATLIILPFHKNVLADGSISFVSPPIQAVNVNVLRYAPCSIGILVDNGLSDRWAMLHRVAVYFLGGADDREALACGVRMTKHAAIELTVLRFLPPKELREVGPEERMDDRMVEKFQQEKVDGKRVVYREEVVKDGEGTVAVIRETSPEFSLLIVGRREGSDSRLTDGMLLWREYPELGVIGDLLASTNFSGRVSTLVIQKQVRVVGAAAPAAESPKGVSTVIQVEPEG